MKVALVTFTDSRLKPVVFEDEHYAMGSWRLSYSNAGGITFTELTDGAVIFHDGKEVGRITMVDLYKSVEHL